MVSHRLTLDVPPKMSHVVYIKRYQHVRNQFLDQLPFIAELLSDPMFHSSIMFFPQSLWIVCCEAFHTCQTREDRNNRFFDEPAPSWPSVPSCSPHPIKFNRCPQPASSEQRTLGWGRRASMICFSKGFIIIKIVFIW